VIIVSLATNKLGAKNWVVTQTGRISTFFRGITQSPHITQMYLCE